MTKQASVNKKLYERDRFVKFELIKKKLPLQTLNKLYRNSSLNS